MSPPRLLLVALLALLTAVSSAAPEAEPWPRWEAHDPQSARLVDHASWNALLARRVLRLADGSTRFDYAAVDAADRAALASYLERLAGTAVSGLSRPQQFALWANLYNALTVRVVLEHPPVESIRDIDISPGFFADGPWGAKLVTVEGEALSLDDIEHRILRPVWGDPRIHYAVNCASVGCPDLLPEAFEAARLDAQLDAAARGYVNHPRGVRVEADGEVVASRIYDWYAVDFGGDERGVLAHLAGYAEPALAARLREATGIDRYEYDWALNRAP